MISNEYLENKELLWQDVRENIKKELSEQTFKTWIDPVTLYRFDNDSATLAIPNSFYGSWLREHYQDLITSSFAILIGKKPIIRYHVQEDDAATVNKILSPVSPLTPIVKKTPFISFL